MSRRPANNIARLTEDVGPLTSSTPTDLAEMIGVAR